MSYNNKWKDFCSQQDSCESCKYRICDCEIEFWKDWARAYERAKVLKCIESHLCVRDEDYDKPILSPKFLKDYLDMMRLDGFEGAEGSTDE